VNQDDTPIRVAIIHPTDPVGVMPGGIDSFIRGQLKYCPSDIEYSVVGMTADNKERPVGQWQTISIGPRTFHFFPIIEWSGDDRRKLLPATVSHLLGMAARREKATSNAQILDFHRIEPLMLFGRDARPKNLTLHQNMSDLYRAGGDIRWRHLPKAYFQLEKRLLPKSDKIFCVREDAANDYRNRFPALQSQISFTPTWADPELFFPANNEAQDDQQRQLYDRWGWPGDSKLIVSVGRLDGQKNPKLLLRAFGLLASRHPESRLAFVGEGPLRSELEGVARAADLTDKIKFLGLLPPAEVASLLRSSHMFALSSRYEGMPIAVIEALACGIPVTATSVGEVGRIVLPGVCGELAESEDVTSFAAALTKCMDNLDRYAGEPCTNAVMQFTPDEVLRPIFQNYRDQASQIGKSSDNLL